MQKRPCVVSPGIHHYPLAHPPHNFLRCAPSDGVKYWAVAVLLLLQGILPLPFNHLLDQINRGRSPFLPNGVKAIYHVALFYVFDRFLHLPSLFAYFARV